MLQRSQKLFDSLFFFGVCYFEFNVICDLRVKVRIDFVLRKLLLLSLLYHLVGSLSFVAINFLWRFQSDWTPLYSVSIWVIGTVISVYLVFLMIERNNDKYEGFVDRFGLKYWCCCFYISVGISSSYDDILIDDYYHRIKSHEDDVFVGIDKLNTDTFSEEPVALKKYRSESVSEI